MTIIKESTPTAYNCCNNQGNPLRTLGTCNNAETNNIIALPKPETVLIMLCPKPSKLFIMKAPYQVIHLDKMQRENERGQGHLLHLE
jgi:hypothetical protein